MAWRIGASVRLVSLLLKLIIRSYKETFLQVIMALQIKLGSVMETTQASNYA